MGDEYDDLLDSLTAPPKRGTPIRGLQPELEKHWTNLQREFQQAGVRPVIKSGFRTAEQQNALHRRGLPTKGNDGYIKISPHQEGRALDIGNLGSKGKQILADYARRNSLHIPSDEPWHIAIPKQKPKDEYDSLLDEVSGRQPALPSQTDPYDSLLDSLAPSHSPTIALAPLLTRPKVRGPMNAERKIRQRPMGVTGGAQGVVAPNADFSSVPGSNLSRVFRRSGDLPVNPNKVEVRPRGFQFNSPSDDSLRADIRVQVANEIASSTPQGRMPRMVDRELDAEVEARLSAIKDQQKRGIEFARTGPSISARQPGLIERAKTAIAPLTPGLQSIDTPAGIKTDALRGAIRGVTLGALGDSREITLEDRLVNPDAERDRNVAEFAGEALPAVLPYVAAGKLASTIPALNRAGRVAGATRTGATFGGVEVAREGIRAVKTGEPIELSEIAISTAIGAAMGGIPGINAGIKQRIFAAVAPQVAVDVARGRTVEEAAQGALTNLLFEVSAGRRLGLSKERIAELRAQVESRQTVPTETQRRLNARQAETQRQGVQTEQPNVELRQAPLAEGRTASSETETGPASAGTDLETPQRFQHLQFGEVSASENQVGVGRGRVRVIDAEGTEHVIQKPNARGAGNERAIPVKEIPVPENVQQQPVELSVPQSKMMRARQADESTGKGSGDDKPQSNSLRELEEHDARLAAERKAVRDSLRQSVPIIEGAKIQGQPTGIAEKGLRLARGVLVVQTPEGELLTSKNGSLFYPTKNSEIADFNAAKKIPNEATAPVNQPTQVDSPETLPKPAIPSSVLPTETGGVQSPSTPEAVSPSVREGEQAKGIDTVLHHGSRAKFEQFSSRYLGNDIGFHFGSQQQADWTELESKHKEWQDFGRKQITAKAQRERDIQSRDEQSAIERARSTLNLNAGDEIVIQNTNSPDLPPAKGKFESFEVINTIGDRPRAMIRGRWYPVEGGERPLEMSVHDLKGVSDGGYYQIEKSSSTVNPPPRLPAPRAPDVPAELSITSARKSQFEQDRAALDLPELPPAERKGWQKTLDEAKIKGTENAGVLADEVLAKPRALNDVETGQLVLRAQEIKNSHSQTMKEIGAATDPGVITAKRNQADALQQEFDRITEATKKSGTEKGRALASQKLTINQDFDLISVIQRAKAAKGKELTGEERTKFEGMTKQIETLNTKLAEANEKLAQRALQREIEKLKRQGKRTETRKALDDEFADLRTQFALARAEVKNVQASGLAGLDPEGKLTFLIARMARNRVRAGVSDAQALVAEVHAVVREHIEGITERDVRDAISGYGLTGKDRRSDLEREVARLRNEMTRLSKQEDIEAGKLAPRREGPSKREQVGPKEGPRRSDIQRVPLQGPRQSDAYRLPAEGPKRSDIQRVPVQGPRLSDAQRSGIPLQGPKLSDVSKVPMPGPRKSEASRSGKPLEGPKQSEARKLKMEGPRITDVPLLGPKPNKIRENLGKQIAEYERKLREKDFTEEPKRGRPIYDRETSNLKAQLEGLKRKVDAEIRGNDSKVETALAVWKAGLLTGPRTHLRNIGGTGAFQLMEEVSRLPGSVADLIVSSVTKRRTLRGPSPIDVARSSYEAATKGLAEAKQIMKYGATAEDLKIVDRPNEINSGSKIIDAYTNTVFRALSAEDKVFRTYAARRSILEQAKLRAKSEGKSVKELEENPTPDMVAQSILDAEVATFNNANAAAKGVEWVRRNTGSAGKVAIDVIVPFRRTPANIMTRLIESTPLGLVKGGGQLVKAAVNKKFTFEDQRKFSQTIGRSVTGSGLIALGAWLAQQGLATGLYEHERGDREVQKAAGQSPMTIRIGDTWHQVGAFSPMGNLMAIGAALYREHNRPPKEGEDPSNVAAAALPVAARTVLEQPMLRGMSGVVEAIKEPGSRGEAFVGQTAGSVVPAIVSNLGEALDDRRREARGITPKILSRIPLLRETLPEDIDVFGRPRETRRTGVIDPTMTSTANDEPFVRELVRLDVGVVKTNKKPGEDDAKHRERVIVQGKEIAKELTAFVSTRGYAAASDEEKREMIKSKVEQVRKAVNEWIKTGGKRRLPDPPKPRQVPYIYRPSL